MIETVFLLLVLIAELGLIGLGIAGIVLLIVGPFWLVAKGLNANRNCRTQAQVGEK